MAKSLRLGRIGVSLDADTVQYINNIKKAQVTTDQRLQEIENRYKRTAKASKELNNASQEVASGFKLQKNAAFNLGYQLQDVVVQAQMGTSAFIILAQQGSQVAGIFGPSGALYGAAIAMAAALGGVLYAALGKTETKLQDLGGVIGSLGENFDGLTDSQKEWTRRSLEGSVAAQSKDIKKLEKEYNKLYYRIAGLLPAYTSYGKYADQVAELQKQQVKVSQDLANAIKGQKVAQDQLNKLNEGSLTTAGKMVKSLQEELITHGYTEKALAIRKARLANASAEEVKAIAFLHDRIAAIKEADDAQKELSKKQESDAKDAARIAKQQLRDAERQAKSIITAGNRTANFEEQLSEQQSILEANRKKDLISEETYQKALESLNFQRLQKELKDETNARTEAARKQQEEMRRAEELEQYRRRLLTDTYNLKKSQADTEHERILVDFERERELLEQRYADQQQQHANNAEVLNEIDAMYKEKKAQIDRDVSTAQAGAILGDLDTIAGAFGVQTDLAGQFAKSQLLMSQAVAFGKAYELGFPTYVPELISLTSSFAGLMGQFHGGTDAVPSSMDNKSFMLKAGERVVQPEANKKLTKFLNEQNNAAGPGGGNGPATIHQTINGGAMMPQKEFEQLLVRSQTALAAVVRGENHKRPTRSR